jgi:PPOX class probable F420-dependent enzyme
MIELDPTIRAFLERPRRFATIATVDADGMPRQAVVWYRVEPDGSILVNSLVGRRWPDNLLRDPRVSLIVPDDYQYIAIRGVAERLHEGQAAEEDIIALARLYERGDELTKREAGFRGLKRISFLIRPKSVTVHN